MRPVVPLAVLVGSTLLGVAVGGLLGAELHIDVTVPEAAVERSTLHMAVQADEAGPAERHGDRCAERDERRAHEERERREHRERRVPRTRRDEAELTHAEVDTLDGEAMARLGRALLHRGPDGEYDGYRISAIRSDTLPERAGLKNGDIVHAINGRPLTSIQDAMRAFDELQDADRYDLELTRRGEPVALTIRVQ